jgi:hypothetical protein
MHDRLRKRLHPSLQWPGDAEPNWPYFIALHCEEGLSWVEEYTRPLHLEMLQGTTESLRSLRARQIDRGHTLLEQIARGLNSVMETSPATAHILGRWYYGALAYCHYCRDEFGLAEQALDQAQEEVRRTVELRRFLLPFASHCNDFCIQRVRIVRAQRRWAEMWRRIEISREMSMGQRPFFLLSDGTSVDLAAVQAFYRSIPGLTREEQKPLRSIFDERIRQQTTERMLAEVFAMPGFVIPYLAGRASR